MRLATGLMVAAVLVCVSSAQALTMEWVTVGDAGNAADTTGYGQVDYVYNIGKYEVTAGQYTAFLNAVAATDTYGLYRASMTTGCGIERTGSAGSWSYSVSASYADRPVNYVSWGDAARFANWMHNGQPSGLQDVTTTEDGAYFLDGATSDEALTTVTREPDARVVLPSGDEWYKAAYYDGDAAVYYEYPTGSDTFPTPEAPPGTDMTDGSANCYSYEDGYVVGLPFYTSEVGAYVAKPSDSPYGTFDQGGNVGEWNELVPFDLYRCVYGGNWGTNSNSMRVTAREVHPPHTDSDRYGFRLVNFWEIGCGDGILQADLGEACDDGNLVSGDGCNASCQEEYCGDGTVQEGLGELCDDGNTLDGDECPADCLTDVCGNGALQPDLGEECDDGNLVDGDGCTSDCYLEFCGDGGVQTLIGEQCDDGNTVSGDGCDADCQDEYCGDGITQPLLGELCDDGNLIDGDGCDADCQVEYCGDGITQPLLGELCDDGNTVDGDGCSAGCATEACGNGVLQPDLGEGCDDGNTVGQDGCSSDCHVEYCGDSVISIGETCDDGNTVDGDGCDANCYVEVCGNGVTQPLLGEECDDGNTLDGDGCDAFCVIEYCGDGTVQTGLGEVCDDGNAVGGDGCDADCYEEVCGNGVAQPALGEECDDGNTLDGDGCAHDCQAESIPCGDHVDCVFANDNCCEWDYCGGIVPGYCDPPIPNLFGDVCGADFPLPPNGAVGLTDILCVLNAFGHGNLGNCPNADVVAVTERDCPHGNGIVGLTDILKVLDAFGAPTSPSATYFCDCPLNP